MISTLAVSAWLATSVPAWLRYRRALQRPKDTQRRLLARLLARNASCQYGRAHGFAAIRSYEQFSASVPVVDYANVAPWIERIMRGERRVLTEENVTRLVPTSGSSGGRKLIPYTASFQRELNSAIGPWMCELCRSHPAVLGGPAYWSISPSFPDSEERSSVPVGFDDDSAYLGGVARLLADATFAVPSSLRLIENAETSRYVTLLCLLRARSLGLVSVWHPSFLGLLLDALERHWKALLADVANGSCQFAETLPREVIPAVERAGDPRRARELRECGPFEMGRIWPHWKILSCWGDAQAALPLAALRPRLPGVFIQPKGLLATEAFVTIPFNGAHPITVTSHFLEFEAADGKVLRAHELLRGGQYTVIVTTGGGLWRYRLGDIVEVDRFVEGTPSLRFLGRGGSTSDLCGEKLTEAFVSSALAATCSACSILPGFAMLAPEAGASGEWHYTLFHDCAAPGNLAMELDRALCVNPHYALCRRIGQLGPLQTFFVERAAYEKFTQATARRVRCIGAIKPQSLSSRTDWRLLFGQ